MSWLLLFVPVAIGLEHFAPERHLLVFFASGLAILPLAGWMGRATEQLAERTGEGVGGLLNATFGNAAELIIALSALRAGLHEVVKASIAGSIVGNILLVLGASMLAGGLRHSEQQFNAAGARSQATMLTLAVIALVLPAGYHAALGASAGAALVSLSIGLSLVLQIVVSILASIVISWFSRRREFGADAFAAQVYGKDSMIGALRAIDRWVNRAQFEYSNQDALATMKISGKTGGFMSLFSTHPPIEVRIAALERL